jgi:hypothetical protein
MHWDASKETTRSYPLWLSMLWHEAAPIGLGDVRGRVKVEITSRKNAIVAQCGGYL